MVDLLVISRLILVCGGRAPGAVVPRKEEPLPPGEKKVEERLSDFIAFMNFILYGTVDARWTVTERTISTDDVAVAFLGLDFQMVREITILVQKTTGGTLVADSVLVAVGTGEVVAWIRTLTPGVKIGLPTATGAGGGVLIPAIASLAIPLAVWGVMEGLKALGFEAPPTQYAPIISNVSDLSLSAENISHIAYTDRELANIDAVIKGAKGPIDVGPSRSTAEMSSIVAELNRMVKPDVGAERAKGIGASEGQYGRPERQAASVKRLASLGFTQEHIRTTLGLSKHDYYDLRYYNRFAPGTSRAENPYDEDE